MNDVRHVHTGTVPKYWPHNYMNLQNQTILQFTTWIRALNKAVISIRAIEPLR